MNKLTLSGLACAALLALTPEAAAHGGKYRGPGDVVPPNAGGGPKTGGPNTPGPVTPGPSAPGAPAPAGPVTPGPAAPGAPPTGGPAGPGPAGGPQTGPRGIQLGADLSKWQFWWEFNKDPFINLREAIHAPSTTTGSDEFFMGSTRRVASKDTAKPSESDINETILPALKRALDSTDNRDINSSCMIALAKIGRDHPSFEILPIFKEYLKKPDQEIRETAALAMGISGLPAGIETLVDLATDSENGRKLCGRGQVDTRTRSFAAYGLGLVAYLNDKIDHKQQCFEALKEMLEDKDARERNLRVAAVNGIALLNIGTENASDKEKKLLDDALKTLDKYYDTKAGRGTDLMRSHVPPAVAKLIGRGNTDRHNAYKQKYAKELTGKRKSNDIYRAAVLALGQLCMPVEKNKADAKFSKALVKYYQNGKEQQAKFFCLLALGQIGGDANKAVLLTELRKGRKALDRPWAALALGVMNHERFENDKRATVDALVGDRLVKQLKEVKTPEVLGAVAVALGLCRYIDSSSTLLEMLMKHRSKDELAGYLCIGLALMNEQKAKEDIHDIVRKSVRRPDLLQQAAIALGKLGDKTVTQTLTGMLQEKETNLAKLSAIASALGFIGDRRTIQPLKKMLFDENLTPLSRAFAAVALGGVADKELLPWNSKIAQNMNYRGAVETLTQSGTGVLDIL